MLEGLYEINQFQTEKRIFTSEEKGAGIFVSSARHRRLSERRRTRRPFLPSRLHAFWLAQTNLGRNGGKCGVRWVIQKMCQICWFPNCASVLSPRQRAQRSLLPGIFYWLTNEEATVRILRVGRRGIHLAKWAEGWHRPHGTRHRVTVGS